MGTVFFTSPGSGAAPFTATHCLILVNIPPQQRPGQPGVALMECGAFGERPLFQRPQADPSGHAVMRSVGLGLIDYPAQESEEDKKMAFSTIQMPRAQLNGGPS